MESEVVYVCQQCPFGCVLKVIVDSDGAFQTVSGNTCERGEEYARLRTQGLDDEAIKRITGSSSESSTSATASEEPHKPARPARYSAYRKRRASTSHNE